MICFRIGTKAVLFIGKLVFNKINTFGTKLLLHKFIVRELAKDDATFSPSIRSRV
jgi:hypothetical protein